MRLILLTLLTLTGLSASAGYWVQTGIAKAYLSVPKKAEGRLPTLLLVHDQSGADAFITQEADRWAEKDFFVLAVDFYHGATGKTEQEAGRLGEKLDPEYAQKVLDAALKYLKTNPKVDKTRIGVMAWGLGANQVLRWNHGEMGIRNEVLLDVQPDLDTTHLKAIQTRILAIYADKDPTLPEKLINQFSKALTDSERQFDIKKIPADHRRYWDYTKTEVYNAKASQELREFLELYLDKYVSLKEIRK